MRVALAVLKEAGVLRATAGNRYALAREADNERLAGIAVAYRDKAQRDRQKLERMTFYAQAALCRWKMLLEYFGELAEWLACGHCDNCQRAPRESHEPAALRLEPQAPDKLQIGDGVELPKFGEGRVSAVTSEQVEVVFPDGRTREFLREYVRRRP
jgi:ATP-dependent DNA helicase RecQ